MGGFQFTGRAPGVRADEHAVRLLFVEHSPDYAALVRETLDRSSHGSFEVRNTARLDAAVEDLERGDYDALLLDFTVSRDESTAKSIDGACQLASRLPVILLTGDESDARGAAAAAVEEFVVRERIARSRLPDAILGAVRRHRRLGQQSASEPIVLRDPLRALAKTFARFRKSLLA